VHFHQLRAISGIRGIRGAIMYNVPAVNTDCSVYMLVAFQLYCKTVQGKSQYASYNPYSTNSANFIRAQFYFHVYLLNITSVQDREVPLKAHVRFLVVWTVHQKSCTLRYLAKQISGQWLQVCLIKLDQTLDSYETWHKKVSYFQKHQITIRPYSTRKWLRPRVIRDQFPY
jgi:hypothetical protein